MPFTPLRRVSVVFGTVLLLWSVSLCADDLAAIEALVNQGSNAQALDRINAYLTNKPKDAQGRFLKGIVLTELNKPAEAIQIFTALTEDYPQLPEPYNNLAVLYAGQGSYDKARVALELAIHTHPSYATAHENLGDIYAKLASRAYDKALQLDKGNATAQDKLALIKSLFGGRGKTMVAKNEPPKAVVEAPKPVETLKPAAAEKPVNEKPIFVDKPVITEKPPAPTPVAAAPVASAPVVPAPAPKPVVPAAPSPVAAPAATPTPPVAATPTKPVTPAPVVVAAPEPKIEPAKPITREHDVNQIVDTVNAWARAWSDKDVQGYLGFYSTQFQPGEGQSRRAWEEARRVRISKPGAIQVSVRDVEVAFEGDAAAVVRFTQAYRSANLSSTNRKSLRMTRSGKHWQIDQERVGG